MWPARITAVRETSRILAQTSFGEPQHVIGDGRAELALPHHFGLTLSAHAEMRAESDVSFPTHENLRLDAREFYASWGPLPGLYLEAGRINLKSGVAVGRNPTDFFKTKAVVEPLSIDPTVLRENRLGTVMIRAHYLWDRGSIAVAFAPRLASARPVYSTPDLPSVDPMLDRTNDGHRLLVKSSVDWHSGLSTEVLGYLEGSQFQFGANLSYGIGASVVVYSEWSGGRRTSLVDEAFRYGHLTGAVPEGAPLPISDDPRFSFQSDFVGGLSYTAWARLTLNLEYQFHQAGMTRQDWNDWFLAGSTLPAPAPSLLWYVRAYANEQQEMVSRHAAFLRGDWPDFLVHDLELTGFVLVNLQDGSGIAQTTTDYYLSNAWTLGALVSVAFGGSRSEFGSLPQAASFLGKVTRYF
jgi:hypothetical protein